MVKLNVTWKTISLGLNISGNICCACTQLVIFRYFNVEMLHILSSTLKPLKALQLLVRLIIENHMRKFPFRIVETYYCESNKTNPASCCLREHCLVTIIPLTLWRGLNVSSVNLRIAWPHLFVQEVCTTPNLPILLHKQQVIMGQYELNEILEYTASWKQFFQASVLTDKHTKPNKVGTAFLFLDWVIH